MSQCRLCRAKTRPLFRKTQLGKYDVQYFECTSCQSAQTEEPYWIDEAYESFTYASDTGMVSRCTGCAHYIISIAHMLGFTSEDVCVDFGGGTGLLTRMLRDVGLNAFWQDKFAKNVFALGFEYRGQTPVKLLTAFEVLEHLPNPEEEIDALFSHNPEYLFLTTKLYSGQDEKWWYFLQDGQHVQFYSKKALERIAARYHYRLQSVGDTYHLFSKPRLRKDFLKKALKKNPKSTSWTSKTESDHVRSLS